MTIRAAVFAFLDQQKNTIWVGVYGLEAIVCKYTKRDTVRIKHVMACAREYAGISGATLECIKGFGAYRFTPGVKVGQAIVD